MKRNNRFYRARAVRQIFAEYREGYANVNHGTMRGLLQMLRLPAYGRAYAVERWKHQRIQRNLRAAFTPPITGTVERVSFTGKLPPAL